MDEVSCTVAIGSTCAANLGHARVFKAVLEIQEEARQGERRLRALHQSGPIPLTEIDRETRVRMQTWMNTLQMKKFEDCGESLKVVAQRGNR